MQLHQCPEFHAIAILLVSTFSRHLHKNGDLVFNGIEFSLRPSICLSLISFRTVYLQSTRYFEMPPPLPRCLSVCLSVCP